MKKINFLKTVFLAAVIFFLVGLGGSYLVQQDTHSKFISEITWTTEVSLAAINPERIKNISSFEPANYTQSPDHARVREQVLRLGNLFLLQGMDAIYVLDKKGESVYFITESTPDGDPFYVRPGKEYELAPPEVFNVFSSHQAIETNKYTDEFGTYISRFSPIIDFQTGEQVGVLGVDVDYNHYLERFYQALLIFWLVWLVIFLAIVFLVMYLRSLYRMKKISTIAEQRIRTIGNAISDGVVVTDNQDKIAFVNTAAADIFGLERDAVVGKAFENVISIGNIFDVELDKNISDFKFSLQSGLAGRIFELTWPSPTGAKNIYEISFALASAGSDEYLVGVFHNITKRKKERAELERQTSNLEKLNNLMSGRELKMIELKKEVLNLKELLAKKK